MVLRSTCGVTFFTPLFRYIGVGDVLASEAKATTGGAAAPAAFARCEA